jgi:hypothetical protein
MGKKLDGLNWNFNMPPTGQARTPAPAGSNAPSATPSPMPSPIESVDPDGHHTLSFQMEEQDFLATWTEGDAQVTVVYKPKDAKPEDPSKTFQVPYSADRDKLMADLQNGYLESLFAAPSPTP